MKLVLVAVGHKLPLWAELGCQTYVKRMPRELPLSIIEIKPETRGHKTREQLLAAEQSRILPAIKPCQRRVVLDERGEDWHTQQLAQQLEQWMQQGGDTAWLMGSADGLAADLKKDADLILRLSSLTLPHAMARLLLCEQLYRAISIIKNHPYHREG